MREEKNISNNRVKYAENSPKLVRTAVVAGTDPGHSRVCGLAAVAVLDGRLSEEKVDVATVGKGAHETRCCGGLRGNGCKCWS